VLVPLLALANALVELAEAEVTVGDEGAHAKLGRECKRLAVVGFSVLGAGRRRDITGEAEGVGFASPSPQPAGKRQRLPDVGSGLVDPPGREAGHPRALKNERRPVVKLATVEFLDRDRDQRDRLVGPAGEGIGGAEGRVVLSREIGGIPVVGAGSKVTVTFLNDGSLVSFRYDWPVYTRTGRAQAMASPTEVLRRLQRVSGVRTKAEVDRALAAPPKLAHQARHHRRIAGYEMRLLRSRIRAS
jgi:hypothetical protein